MILIKRLIEIYLAIFVTLAEISAKKTSDLGETQTRENYSGDKKSSSTEHRDL